MTARIANGWHEARAVVPALQSERRRPVGGGLCDPVAVRVLAEEGPAEVSQLLDWGMRIDRAPD
ncbi:MAG: hypothetical protein ACKOJI_06370, partial [Phycisphaerales bacterium]